MSKRTKIILIVGAAAVAVYFLYRFWQNSQNNQNAAAGQSPTGGLGTNLNSVAPELVGGSTGPAVGPALSAPVNITLNEQIAPAPDTSGNEQTSANGSSTNILKRQNQIAQQTGTSPKTQTYPTAPGAKPVPAVHVTPPTTKPGAPKPVPAVKPVAKKPVAVKKPVPTKKKVA